jgi:hypothetical protein
MRAKGKIVGASKVAGDIAERKRINDLIADSREHVRALRRGCGDVADHIASSREAIEHSVRLLRLAGKIEAELGQPITTRPAEPRQDELIPG